MRRFIVLLPLLLGACTYNGLAQLYPQNAEAQKLGAFSIVYKDIGLNGPVAFSLPNGEHFQGTYTSLPQGYSMSSGSFAMLNTNAFSSNPQFAQEIANSRANVSADTIPGVVSAQGDRGTSVSCEYMVTKSARSGIGACQTNTGALYRMHFSITR